MKRIKNTWRMRLVVRTAWFAAHCAALLGLLVYPHSHCSVPVPASLAWAGGSAAPSHAHPAALAVLLVLFAVCVVAYGFVTFGDPGHYPQAPRSTSNQTGHGRADAGGDTPGGALIPVSPGVSPACTADDLRSGLVILQGTCRFCGTQQLLRTKHCHYCNRCVKRWDHHCLWAANCVGQNNHRSFIVYTVAQMLLAVFALVESAVGVVLGYYSPYVWIPIVIGVVSVPFIVFTIKLLKLHLWLVGANFTTFEYLYGVRIPFGDGRLWGEVSPYDMGTPALNFTHFGMKMHTSIVVEACKRVVGRWQLDDHGNFVYALPVAWFDVYRIPRQYRFFETVKKEKKSAKLHVSGNKSHQPVKGGSSTGAVAASGGEMKTAKKRRRVRRVRKGAHQAAVDQNTATPRALEEGGGVEGRDSSPAVPLSHIGTPQGPSSSSSAPFSARGSVRSSSHAHVPRTPTAPPTTARRAFCGGVCGAAPSQTVAAAGGGGRSGGDNHGGHVGDMTQPATPGGPSAGGSEGSAPALATTPGGPADAGTRPRHTSRRPAWMIPAAPADRRETASLWYLLTHGRRSGGGTDANSGGGGGSPARPAGSERPAFTPASTRAGAGVGAQETADADGSSPEYEYEYVTDSDASEAPADEEGEVSEGETDTESVQVDGGSQAGSSVAGTPGAPPSLRGSAQGVPPLHIPSPGDPASVRPVAP